VSPLRRTFRRLLYATLAVLLISGGLWEWVHSALLMKVHGGAAMLVLLLLGALLASHVPTGWKEARYKKTGIGILAAAAWLIISGHVLYYSGDEAVRQAASYSHLGIGLALPLLLGFHVWRRSSGTMCPVPWRALPGPARSWPWRRNPRDDQHQTDDRPGEAMVHRGG